MLFLVMSKPIQVILVCLSQEAAEANKSMIGFISWVVRIEVIYIILHLSDMVVGI